LKKEKGEVRIAGKSTSSTGTQLRKGMEHRGRLTASCKGGGKGKRASKHHFLGERKEKVMTPTRECGNNKGGDLSFLLFLEAKAWEKGRGREAHSLPNFLAP